MKKSKNTNPSDHVVMAVNEEARPLTAQMIFQRVDCFDTLEACTRELRTMCNAGLLASRRLPGESHAWYATPGMEFPDSPNAPVGGVNAVKPVPTTGLSEEEIEMARRCSPVETSPPFAPVERAARNFVPATVGRRAARREDDSEDAAFDDVLDFLQDHLSPEEYRGYVRGNVIIYSLRGNRDDVQRGAVFAKRLAGLV